MRLIDADELLKRIKDYPYGYRGMIENDVAQMPTIESEPKHGRWIVCDDLYKTIDGRVFDGYRECSVCGEMYPYFPEHNYCPNCGARMDGGEDD